MSEEQHQMWLKRPLKDRILEVVDSFPGTSFAELERIFNEEFKGTSIFGLRDQNIYFWINMNQEFINAMRELIKENKLKMEKCYIITYLMDGKCLTLPIAKRTGHVFTKPHWLPLVFFTVREKQ